MIFSLGPVWSLTPSFRAEKSRTVRHLAEFSHLEAEAPWVTLDDILKVQEQLVSYVIQNTIRERAEELVYLKRDVADLKKVEPPFERLPYENAIDILRTKGFTIVHENGSKREIRVGDDLNIDSERELTKNASKPVFVRPREKGRRSCGRHAGTAGLWRDNERRAQRRRHRLNDWAHQEGRA
jgi:asparaginyl-tRNA synthetase